MKDWVVFYLREVVYFLSVVDCTYIYLSDGCCHVSLSLVTLIWSYVVEGRNYNLVHTKKIHCIALSFMIFFVVYKPTRVKKRKK